jgi:hypothetical protein
METVGGRASDLFNIYMNKAMEEWKETSQIGIHPNSRKIIQSVLHDDDDDQVILAEGEDELKIAANELNKISKKYDMKISSTKNQ